MRDIFEPRRISLIRPHAFTMIEVVLVLGMIALVAGIAIPRYSGAIARHRTDLAARRIVVDLELSRAEARATGRNVSVVFSPDDQTYVIAGIPDLRSPQQSYTVDLARPPYQVQLGAAEFSGDHTVEFNAYGVPDSGGAVVVQTGSYARTVTLDANTGTASVQ